MIRKVYHNVKPSDLKLADAFGLDQDLKKQNTVDKMEADLNKIV